MTRICRRVKGDDDIQGTNHKISTIIEAAGAVALIRSVSTHACYFEEATRLPLKVNRAYDADENRAGVPLALHTPAN